MGFCGASPRCYAKEEEEVEVRGGGNREERKERGKAGGKEEKENRGRINLELAASFQREESNAHLPNSSVERKERC